MKYDSVKPISRSEAEAALASNDPVRVTDALVRIAFHESDWRWAQETFLGHLDNSNPEIRGLAATCLGHIARIHGEIDRTRVVPALEKLTNDREIGGQAADALEDIEIYAGDV